MYVIEGLTAKETSKEAETIPETILILIGMVLFFTYIERATTIPIENKTKIIFKILREL